MSPGGFSGGGILFSTVVAKVPVENRVVVEDAVSEGFAPIDDRNFDANNTAAISTTVAALLQIRRREGAAWLLAFMLRNCLLPFRFRERQRSTRRDYFRANVDRNVLTAAALNLVVPLFVIGPNLRSCLSFRMDSFVHIRLLQCSAESVGAFLLPPTDLFHK
jgi:hypothetical protein